MASPQKRPAVLGPDLVASAGGLVADQDSSRLSEPHLSRRAAVSAMHAGAGARRAQQPSSTCPFPLSGSVADQFLAHWWIKGWRRAGATPASAGFQRDVQG